MKQSYEVEIYGQRFTIRSDRPQPFVDRVVEMVNRRMKDVAGSSSEIAPMSAAILTAMNLAEELLETMDRQSSDNQRLETVVEKIDQELSSLLCT